MYKFIIFSALVILSFVSMAAVNIDLTFAENDEGVVFSGKTNLPNGTKLSVTISDGNEYRAQDFQIFASNGKFFTRQFSNQGGPLVGTFVITVQINADPNWQKSPELLANLKKLPEFNGAPNYKKELVATLGTRLVPSTQSSSKPERNQDKLQAIVRQIAMLPCKKGGTVSDCLDSEVAIPTVTDHGWVVRARGDGDEVERQVQIDGLPSKKIYRWVIFANGLIVTANGHAKALSASHVQNIQSERTQ